MRHRHPCLISGFCGPTDDCVSSSDAGKTRPVRVIPSVLHLASQRLSGLIVWDANATVAALLASSERIPRAIAGVEPKVVAGVHMEVHQMRYFVALCDSLNFTRAAEACNVSQPSLTRAIKLLEHELGGALFVRDRSRTRLTELGLLMKPYLSGVLAQIEGAKNEARTLNRQQRTSLKLGVMCTIGPTMFLSLISRFRDRHPEVDLSLRDAKGQELARMLLDGELEVAILALPGELDARLHAVPLFSESFMVTFAPGHRFERLNAVRAADLDGEAYISRSNCEFGEHIGRCLDDMGVHVNVCYRSERDDWVAAMVMAGLGVGSAPANAILVPGLQARRMVEPEFVRSVSVVTVRGRPHSPAVGALVRSAMAWRSSYFDSVSEGDSLSETG